MNSPAVDLSGWCVLVTRPHPQGERLVQTLEHLGARALHIPLMTIEPRVPENSSLLADLGRYDKVIAISAAAVEQAFGYRPRGAGSTRWYTPGAATAAALVHHGVKACYPQTESTSEALLALPEMQDVRQQRILLLKGEGGRTLLAEELQRRGAHLDALDLYTRGRPAYQAGYLERIVQDAGVGAMVATSGQLVHQLLEISVQPELLLGIPLLVPGVRVAGLARSGGFRRVQVMDAADDAAVVSALVRLGNGHKGSEQALR